MNLEGDHMSKKNKSQTTIFDQSNQSVHHQVNIAGGDNQTNKIDLSSNVEELFGEALAFVAASNLSASEKADINKKISDIEKEIAKGESANSNIFSSLLKATVEKIPELALILLQAILNPVAGASAGIKMIAEKILKPG